MSRNSKYYGIRFDRRSQNFGFHMIARSQLIADDRRIAGSQSIAEVCFHMIADDRRTFCDLRSAIRDRLRSYGNQPLPRCIAIIKFVICHNEDFSKDNGCFNGNPES